MTTEEKTGGGFLYFLLQVYAAMISYFYFKSIFWAIVSFIFGPLYVLYSLIAGRLSHGMWQIIPNSYFN